MDTKSRVVLLTELQMLFDRRMLPRPANRISLRPPEGAAATTMNRLPRGASAMGLPRGVALAQPAALPGERNLGVAAPAPIWAWAGNRGDVRPPALAPAPSHASGTAPICAVPEARARSAAHMRATSGTNAGLPRTDATHDAPGMDAPGMDASGFDVRPREVRIPSEVLRAMAAIAAQTGRRESEVWAEAAREWLDRQVPGDEPPPTSAALAPTPAIRTSRDRCWGAIDILLGDLRAPNPVPVPAVARLLGSWDGSAA